MREVVIVEAVRTPIGRRNGGLSTMHSIDLLGAVQRDLFLRTGLDPQEVGQVVGGCVGQTGMQAMNVTRNAWLAAGLPLEVAATTVDAQCGSSQQATNLVCSLIASGVVDCAVACGVEIMPPVMHAAWKTNRRRTPADDPELSANQRSVVSGEKKHITVLFADEAGSGP